MSFLEQFLKDTNNTSSSSSPAANQHHSQQQLHNHSGQQQHRVSRTSVGSLHQREQLEQHYQQQQAAHPRRPSYLADEEPEGEFGGGDAGVGAEGSLASSQSNVSDLSPQEQQQPQPPQVHSATGSTSRLMGVPPPPPPAAAAAVIQQQQGMIQVGPKVSKSHQFLIRTFSSPLKCNHCTSLMVGLTRQGVVCEVCGFACHIQCRDKVPSSCPVPPDQSKWSRQRK